jgi:hypothetical protein
MLRHVGQLPLPLQRGGRISAGLHFRLDSCSVRNKHRPSSRFAGFDDRPISGRARFPVVPSEKMLNEGVYSSPRLLVEFGICKAAEPVNLLGPKTREGGVASELFQFRALRLRSHSGHATPGPHQHDQKELFLSRADRSASVSIQIESSNLFREPVL